MRSTHYACQILINLEFSQKISEKYPNIKFHMNSSSGNRVVPCEHTDRHDETNSRFCTFENSSTKTPTSFMLANSSPGVLNEPSYVVLNFI